MGTLCNVVMGTLAHCHFILATSKLDTDPPPLWLRDENPYSDLLSIVREHPSIKLITNPGTCFSRKSSHNAVFDVVEMEKYPVPLTLFIDFPSRFNCLNPNCFYVFNDFIKNTKSTNPVPV